MSKRASPNFRRSNFQLLGSHIRSSRGNYSDEVGRLTLIIRISGIVLLIDQNISPLIGLYQTSDYNSTIHGILKNELFVTHMIYNRMKAYIKQTDHPDEKDEMFKLPLKSIDSHTCIERYQSKLKPTTICFHPTTVAPNMIIIVIDPAIYSRVLKAPQFFVCKVQIFV